MRRVRTAGDRALLIDTDGPVSALRLTTALRTLAAETVGMGEVVPAAQTVLVRFDPFRVTATALTEAVAQVPLDETDAAAFPVVEIPVCYDGQDLDEVADLLGVSRDELIARHQRADWRVAFTGFAPGFGYLVGDDPLFQVPRRGTPRPRIPAGSVALAGAYSGVYPRESPGGWQLIGRTDEVMWELTRDPPALLRPGTPVRFTRAARTVLRMPGIVPAPAPTGFAIEVLRPGAQLTVQDLGRAGHAALGVSASGAADRVALRTANRAVGNSAGSAALEIAGGGTLLKARGPAVIALCGGRVDAVLDRVDGSSLPIETGVPIAVADGDEVRIGGFQTGLRAVLAVRGGLALAPVLGSLAQDTLAGLGPAGLGEAGLVTGDVVPCHGPTAVQRAVETVLDGRTLPAPGDLVTLRVVFGPRDEWFTPKAHAELVTQEWVVTPRADRVGVRLEAPTPLERGRVGELPSEAAVTGSLQVPPDGMPVLFLPDHPLTGGYPVIAAVIDSDLDLLGQLPPGCRIRFSPVPGTAPASRD